MSILTSTPRIRVQTTVFDHLQGHYRDDSDASIEGLLVVQQLYCCKKKIFRTRHTGQRGACPKHGDAPCSNATYFHSTALDKTLFHALHIPGPSQSPRVDEPHPATVAGARPAVAGCAIKHVAQVVRNGRGVSDGDYRKFS